MKNIAWRKLCKSILACFFAAIITTFCLFVFDLTKNYLQDQSLDIYLKTFGMTLWVVIFFGIGVFGSLLIIGLPIQAWMQKHGATQLIPHVLLAMFFGSILTCLASRSDSGETFLLGLITGAMCSVIAWLIRRPDKDAVRL